MSDAKNHGESAPKMRDDQELSCDAEARLLEGHDYTPSLAAEHARAVQGLRDVRHLLPPDGVAIVDAALAGMRFSDDEAPLYDFGIESAG
jgi:hypothetical protein